MTHTTTPKTLQEWRSERLKKAKREGGFILIPMELWNGEAFHALSKSEKLILLECLAQLRYAPRSAKKRAALRDQNMLQCGLGHLLNNGEFGLPTKYLQERGIKGEDTIANAKRTLVRLGFMDVVTQGSFAKAGRFRYSDRWRTYDSANQIFERGNNVQEGLMPGYCHYPNIIYANRNNKGAQEPIEVTTNNHHDYDHEHAFPFIQEVLFPEYAEAA